MREEHRLKNIRELDRRVGTSCAECEKNWRSRRTTESKTKFESYTLQVGNRQMEQEGTYEVEQGRVEN